MIVQLRTLQQYPDRWGPLARPLDDLGVGMRVARLRARLRPWNGCPRVGCGGIGAGGSSRRGRSTGMRQLAPVKIAELLREVPGQWVAIRDGKIIEARRTADEVMAALARRCIAEAVVLRSPERNEAESVGIG